MQPRNCILNFISQPCETDGYISDNMSLEGGSAESEGEVGIVQATSNKRGIPGRKNSLHEAPEVK